jgi:hypothetical protein
LRRQKAASASNLLAGFSTRIRAISDGFEVPTNSEEVARRLLSKQAWISTGENGWTMRLLVYYVVFMVAGDFASYFIGLGIENVWGATGSLWAFLILYFLLLWVAWLIAVWITEPKKVPETAS